MVREYAKNGVDINKEVAMLCPGKCIEWDGNELKIDNSNCRHCMHCINVMPKALAPGKDRGACILLGSKAPIVEGAILSSVIVPFVKLDDEQSFNDVVELIDAILEPWIEEGKNRERVGEFIQRVGLGNFLDAIGLEPQPEMIKHPRTNPYVFYEGSLEEE